MGIIRSDGIYSADEYVEGLTRARRAIARISVTDPLRPSVRGGGSGWFAAPGLVVVPAFMVDTGDGARKDIVVELRGPKRPIFREKVIGRPEIIPAPSNASPIDSLAILRVPQHDAQVLLPLSFEAVTEQSSVALIYFGQDSTSPSLGFGSITSTSASKLSYDASTLPGSAGAPILDHRWRVIGLHSSFDAEKRVNWGLARGLVIDMLRQSKYWKRIKRAHRIADTDAALRSLSPKENQAPPLHLNPIVLAAAISPTLERANLNADDAAVLQPLVIDEEAKIWALRANTRQSVIAAAGLRRLSDARRRTPIRHEAAPVINNILDGPPYRYAEASEEMLAWWVQAARWFEGVAPDLPSTGELRRELERRRVRSRLSRIFGPDFRGRKKNLDELDAWFADPSGPYLLTGIGGIGKSALVAKFASSLPSETLIFWLDFDRADLAPDNANSIVTALEQQLNIQTDGAPPAAGASWEDRARAIGERIGKNKRPHLLVLDSFEAAQFRERYQDLWPVLEIVDRLAPNLRVCVTGRAFVPDLDLNERKAVHKDLQGLAPEDAEAWLNANGVKAKKVVSSVVKLSRGVPLILRLAVLFVEKGGAVSDLPDALPERIVAGYLYDRILNRVHDPDLKPLARGVLVLRRFTAEMLRPVLNGIVEFPAAGEPIDWMERLAREMAMVEGEDVLHVRPEVRTATLALLENEDKKQVRRIDERAVDWYREHQDGTPELAAELVYHLLRLGDVAAAHEAWREGCGGALATSAEELPDASAEWLRQRLGQAPVATGALALEAWEAEASERIRGARARGLLSAAVSILSERSDRSPTSPLVFHDAYELYRSGDSIRARRVLDEAGDAPGAIGRDRRLLGALLAQKGGDVRRADALLAPSCKPKDWPEHRQSDLRTLSVHAARLRLTVMSKVELTILERAQSRVSDLSPILSAVDATLPKLKLALLDRKQMQESYALSADAVFPSRGGELLEAIESERRHALRNEFIPGRRARIKLFEDWSKVDVWSPYDQADESLESLDTYLRQAVQVAECGWRRSWYVSRPDLLTRFHSFAMRIKKPNELELAVIGAFAVFATRLGRLTISGIANLMRDAMRARGAIETTPYNWSNIAMLLERGVDPSINWDEYCHSSGSLINLTAMSEYRGSDNSVYSENLGPFLLSIVAPDPLQLLVEEASGEISRL